MMRTLTLILILFGFYYGFSQDFVGQAANQKLKGTSYLHYEEGNSLPSFVKFAPGNQLDLSVFNKWLIQSIKLPSNTSFKEISRFTDQIGQTHIRYQQALDGISIREGVLIVHLQEGKVISFNGKLINASNPNQSISLSEKDALKFALNHVNAEVYKWEVPSEEAFIKKFENNLDASFYPKGEIWILNTKNNETKYAYKFDVYAHQPLSRADIFVDASNGTILFTNNKIQHQDTVGTAITKFSGSRAITSDLNGTNFRLRESARGNGIETYNLLTGSNYGSAVDFIDSDNYWNNINTQKDEVATDAHWGMEKTYDYYFTKFNRNSIDGLGFKLMSYVHYNVNYANAFWDGQRMTFGDGNSTMQPLVALDIVAHEISHGLTTFTADLDYQDESGAMNEGFSDIFGACIEKFAKGGTGTWTMGEDINYIMRSMANPNQYGDPDTYLGSNYYIGTADNGGVHTNSGVLNHWFYRLTVGGTGTNDIGQAYNVTGIGIDSAAAIAFRTLTVYLVNTSQYADGRFYAIQSAIDLYGPCSLPVQSTTNAFHAVGIGNQYVAGVQADFNATIKLYCAPPADVVFTNLSNNANNFTWYFGDGTSSTQMNPTHTYSNYGGYVVKLVSSGGSCGVDSIVKYDYIIVDSAYPCQTFMPTSGQQTYSTCKGLLYDSGGNNNYPDNSSTKATISVSGASSIKLSFVSFNFEAGYDFLKIYDGPTTNSPLIGTYDGTSLPNGGIITSTSGSITLWQTSDQASNYDGFIAEWQCMMPTVPPVTDFKNDSVSCSGVVNFTDKTQNGPIAWLWNFGDGTSSTLQNPSHTYSQSGYYNVSLQATNIIGNHQIMKSNAIHITLPEIQVVSKSACLPSSLTLSANVPYGDVIWYDSQLPTAIPIDTGLSFTTPLINQTTNYYAESVISHALLSTGKPSNAGGGGYLGTEHYLVFDVYKQIVLKSVRVYAETAGTRTIRLLNSVGNQLATKTITVNAGVNQVALDFNIAPGSDYRLSGKDLYRNNASTNYPYTVANYIKIKHSSATQNPTGYYYYFYDWKIKEPDCISPRVPVYAYINNAAPVADFSYVNIDPRIDFTDISTNKGTNTWNFGDGTNVVADNPSHTYSNNGNYTVSLSVDNGCGTNTKTKQITILSTAIQNLYSNQDFKVYPIPAHNKLYVEIDVKEEMKEALLYDADGRLIRTYKMDSSRDIHEFDIQNINAGFYVLRLGSKNIKLLIQ